jgi:hypothetical protein
MGYIPLSILAWLVNRFQIAQRLGDPFSQQLLNYFGQYPQVEIILVNDAVLAALLWVGHFRGLARQETAGEQRGLNWEKIGIIVVTLGILTSVVGRALFYVLTGEPYTLFYQRRILLDFLSGTAYLLLLFALLFPARVPRRIVPWIPYIFIGVNIVILILSRMTNGAPAVYTEVTLQIGLIVLLLLDRQHV